MKPSGSDTVSGRVQQVAPTIQMLPVRTPTLPPATHTNTFVVGTGEAVLVEPATPYRDEQDVMVEWVQSTRLRGVEPVAILATHHHPDHVGGAVALRERLQLPLWVHAMTAKRLDGIVEVDRLIQDGERIELEGSVPTALTALHTPGHAPGHLCFIDAASGMMIAGDMVASVGTIIVEPTDGDMLLYIESLRTMSSLEPAALLPAHGDVIREPQAILSFYIEHRLMREAKVLEALETRGTPSRPRHLVAKAYDDTPKALWPLALGSLEAHLIKLEREGRVRKTGDRWAPLP
ncbi:MAG: MBL fold metallo-hydrolase [Myxococcales bacterium]|jgi:glyoxylase-like metal-dependent hydrolase (beta-lactamase superfamily II)